MQTVCGRADERQDVGNVVPEPSYDQLGLSPNSLGTSRRQAWPGYEPRAPCAINARCLLETRRAAGCRFRPEGRAWGVGGVRGRNGNPVGLQRVGLLLVTGAPAVRSLAPRVSVGLAVPRGFSVNSRRRRHGRWRRSGRLLNRLGLRLLGGGGLGGNGNRSPPLERFLRVGHPVPVRVLALRTARRNLPIPRQPDVAAKVALERFDHLAHNFYLK